MKDVLIISNYWHFYNEKTSSRYLTVANILQEKFGNVEVVTSSFYHTKKKQRNAEEIIADKYEYRLIKEMGYKKNISLNRIISHKFFADNVYKYLLNRKKPDIIYCFVPSLSLGKVVAKFAKENDINFVIDILDLWPEAFSMVLKVPFLFYPLEKIANHIYSSADKIVAVSDTYLKRALLTSNVKKNSLSVYIGTDLDYFDKFSKNENHLKKEKNEIWVAYIGMLGHSYDINCVTKALRDLKNKGYSKVKFLIMGDGPLKDKFSEYAKNQKINYKFTGRLEYEKMVGYLCQCDIAVNPISKGAAQSIINKVGDYAAAGLPVINTQECEEYRDLIDRYKCGFNCKNSSHEDLSSKLEILINDKNLRKIFGKNSRRLAEEKFDRKKTYKKIVELMDE
ncbi:glycosyltransferase family 4 protein [Fusobacterium sp. MFO224]|uniref:glycosyltransferase family 4 protein n=1 Tax=Fusobacterium sp. MFO224 TaxID=3378070 RepID=UPI003851F5BB